MIIRLPALAAMLVVFAAAAPFAVAPAAAQAGAQDCQGTFAKLKAGIDKYGQAIQAANKRKASVTEACSLFNSYVAVETKMLHFFKTSQTQCGIPEEAIKNLSKSHAHSVSMRTKICTAAKGGGPRPPSAGLSSALGLNSSTIATDSKPSGLFDTLNGNVLK